MFAHAGEPGHATTPGVASHTHPPATHVPVPQRNPHAPQLASSDARSAQNPWTSTIRHTSCPGGHAHWPPRHAAPSGQIAPHDPQFLGSDPRSTQNGDPRPALSGQNARSSPHGDGAAGTHPDAATASAAIAIAALRCPGGRTRTRDPGERVEHAAAPGRECDQGPAIARSRLTPRVNHDRLRQLSDTPERAARRLPADVRRACRSRRAGHRYTNGPAELAGPSRGSDAAEPRPRGTYFPPRTARVAFASASNTLGICASAQDENATRSSRLPSAIVPTPESSRARTRTASASASLRRTHMK